MSIQLGAAPGKLAAMIVILVIYTAIYAVIASWINDSAASQRKKRARKELAWHAILILMVLTVASVMIR